jgi:hypothetical protein
MKLIKVCGWCKSVKENDIWTETKIDMNQLKENELVSHGICDPCSIKVYKEIEFLNSSQFSLEGNLP